MDPIEAKRICGQAAGTLAETLGRETYVQARSSLASALSKLASRMDSIEAARNCGQAARALAEALGREKEDQVRSSLASALSVVAGCMDPIEASRVCGDVMRLSAQRIVEKPPAGGPWGDPTLVSELLRYLDPARAKSLTREIVMGLASQRNFNELYWSAMVDDISMAEISRRASSWC